MSDQDEPEALWESGSLDFLRQLVEDAGGGDKKALDRLFPIVYAQLCRLADACLRRERPHHTLQRTALVHEAYFSGLTAEESADLLNMDVKDVRRELRLAQHGCPVSFSAGACAESHHLLIPLHLI